jgi:hypothetical protein
MRSPIRQLLEFVEAGTNAHAEYCANHSGSKQIDRQTLVAEAGADSHTLAADGATAAQHGCAAFGLHPRAESVRLNALAAVGLECALRHKNALLFLIENLCLDGKS